MLRTIAVAATSLFIMGASPVATYNDCFDGCVLNCIWRGGSPVACEGVCMDIVCAAGTSASA